MSFLWYTALIPFYLIGCIPTGYLIARSAGVDITSQGSGNPGATNVARILGKRAGIYTLLGDVMKGAIAVLIAKMLTFSIPFIAAAAMVAVFGHCFSIPGRLKGGKGVATSLGVITTMSPLSGLVGVLSFGIAFLISKRVAVGSIAAALVVPIGALLLQTPDPIVGAFAAIALVVVYRHKENIIRLIEGTEPAFSIAKSKTEQATP